MNSGLATHLIIEGLTKSLREVDNQLNMHRDRSSDVYSRNYRQLTPPPSYSLSKSKLHEPKKKIGAGGSYAKSMNQRKYEDQRSSDIDSLKEVEQRLQESEDYLLSRQQYNAPRQYNPRGFSFSGLLSDSTFPRLAKLEEVLKESAQDLKDQGMDLLREQKEIELKEQTLNLRSEKLRDKENKLQDIEYEVNWKEKEIIKQQKELENKIQKIDKEHGKTICKTIANDIVWNAMFEIVNRKELAIANRDKACILAFDKMKKTTEKVEHLKRQLEQEALKVIDTKYRLEQQEKEILAAQDAALKESKIFGDGNIDKALRKREELIKQKESAYNEKIRKLAQKQTELETKERQLQLKEKVVNDGTPQKRTPSKSPVRDDTSKKEKILQDRELAIKKREEELLQEDSALEERRKKLTQNWEKMIGRIDNLHKLESKTGASKDEIEQRKQDFLNFKKEEENKLRNWETSLQNQESAFLIKQKRAEERIKKIKDKEKVLEAREEEIKHKEAEFEVKLKEIMGKVEATKMASVGSVGEEDEASRYQTLAEDLSDFAEQFLRRQSQRRQEIDEISKEKQQLSQKLTDILSELE